MVEAGPPGSHGGGRQEGGRNGSGGDCDEAMEAGRGEGGVPCLGSGGAEGLEASVLARADARLSLGQLTWPHMLVRIMLVEQIYRAQAIAGGHPYHRSGRP